MNLKSASLNTASCAAIAVLVLIAAFHLLYPKPGQTAGTKAQTVEEMRTKAKQDQSRLDALAAQNAGLVWSVGRDEVGPKAMAWVSRQAAANFVKVSAFRPQNVVEVGDLVQLNYLVTTEGPYLSVMNLIRQIESKDSHLAIKMVQIGSINGATDDVRASVGLVAYQEAEKGG